MRVRVDSAFAAALCSPGQNGDSRERLDDCELCRAGVSYSLSVVLMLPFYVLLVCFLVEVVMLLNTQTGVDYASWAAARAAAVWVPAEATNPEAAERNLEMVRRAAVNALSLWATNSSAGAVPADQQGAEAVVSVSRAAEGARAHSAAWIRSKWNAAAEATRVEFDPLPQQLKSLDFSQPVELSVTVHYARPFFTPGVGRILGRRTAAGFVRDLRATTTITVEFPRSATGSLGWEYDSRPAAGQRGNNVVGRWLNLSSESPGRDSDSALRVAEF